MKKLEDYVISIPDFPEPGIIFRDITSIIGNADGLKLAVDELQAAVKDLDFDVIAGLEARGFIFGMPLAYNLHKPFIPIRKQGKLPRETAEQEYDLEYGTATLQVHLDSFGPGDKVLLGDADGDGEVTILDATLIQRFNAGIINKFPVQS